MSIVAQGVIRKPLSYQKALRSSESHLWKETMDDEVKSLEANHTWDLFIVRADLASDQDFHLTAERAEYSDFEFYCIFERIWARAEWSQARHLGHVTLGYIR